MRLATNEDGLKTPDHSEHLIKAHLGIRCVFHVVSVLPGIFTITSNKPYEGLFSCT